jgi:hypothetical protein
MLRKEDRSAARRIEWTAAGRIPGAPSFLRTPTGIDYSIRDASTGEGLDPGEASTVVDSLTAATTAAIEV